MRNTSPDTRLAHVGRDPEKQNGAVNPPVYRASTILFPTVAAMEDAGHGFDKWRYGRAGTPTSRAFEDALAELEGGYRGVVAPSGLGAITTALMAFLKAGDHLLMTDSVYGPTRFFCDSVLARFGVETTYYDPTLGAGVANLIRPETRVVYVESPGSQTFEIQDVPAIAAASKRAGAVVVADNTWATPLYCRPLELGADVVIHAATKYVVGHSDAMLGAIVCARDVFDQVKTTAYQLGVFAGPDDVNLGLRGLRTLGVRLERHQKTALALAAWLRDRPEVARVLHPALPDHPQHALWRRDFSGASGLFGVVLKPASKKAVAAMLDGMELFGMGWSWGGFESLLIPSNLKNLRSATAADIGGPLLRVHAGLEDPDDLIADLDRGLARLRAAEA